MRYACLFLLLTVIAAGQAVPIDTNWVEPSNRYHWVSDSGRAYMVIDTIYIAPSGKVVRVVDHPVRWHLMDYYPDRNIPDPVRVILRYGCPVCGSEECFTLDIVEHVWMEKASLDEREYNRDKKNIGAWNASVFQMGRIIASMKVGSESARLSSCTQCGTVYSGRRKQLTHSK